MKTGFRNLLTSALFLLPLAASADTIYVTDVWRFELRESPCWDCSILRSLATGTELEIIETDESVEDWTHVRTQGGNQGWISNRYLSESPSAASRLDEALRIAADAATERALLREQFERLSREISAAGIDIEITEVASEDGSVVVQTPQIVGNLATVGLQNEELLRQNQLLQNELDLRIAEIDRLSDDSWQTYFLYGGGAVFAGVVLCLVLIRLRPRRGYSEWG